MLNMAGHTVASHFRSNLDITTQSLVQKTRLGASTIWSVESYRALRTIIRRERPDVAHFHNTFPLISPAAYSACHEAGVPVVQSLHNYRLLCPGANLLREGRPCEDCVGKWFAWPGVLHGCYRESRAMTGVVAAMVALHRELDTWQEHVNFFIAPSEFARQKFIQGGLPAEKIAVKPHFVYPDPGGRISHGEFAIYIGRLSEEKGLQKLMEAWKLAGVRLPLRIVGDGPLRKNLQLERDRLGLLSVHFDGQLESHRVLSILKAARFLVLPSNCYEVFSMAIAEAFACGVPAIASRHGAIAEIVEDGSTGLLFDPSDSKDLAAKMDWACRNPVPLAEMGRAARARYLSKFTAERNLPQLVSIYECAGAKRSFQVSQERNSTVAGERTISTNSSIPSKSFPVLGVRVHALQISDVIQEMRRWIKERSRCRTIAVTGMHGVMEAQHDMRFREVLAAADAVVPDGMPLVWLGRLRGFALPRRVYGPELMMNFCEQTATEGYRHFFYGGPPGLAERLAAILGHKFPGLEVAGAYSPPFRPLTPQEDSEIIDMINAAAPDILWVGLGTPKQERWMEEHRKQLRIPVLVGVGAAFDFHAGTKAQAPFWMREHGLEWLFRLVQEPRRLWKRYLVYGSEFVVRVGLELIGAGRNAPAK